MLTRFGVRNFKSIGDEKEGVTLLLKPLNVLVGENGAGKSSILEALALFGQSVERRHLEAKGELVDYGSKFDPIMHKTQTGRWLTFQIGTEFSEEEIGSLGTGTGEYVYDYRLKPSTEENEHRLSFVDREGRTERHLVTSYSISTGPRSRQATVNYQGWGDYQYRTSVSNSYLGGGIFRPEEGLNDPSSRKIGDMRRIERDLNDLCDKIAARLDNKIRLLSALRGEVPQITPPRGEFTWVGKRGEHLMSLLSIIYGSRHHLQTQEKISQWANRFGLRELKAGYRGGEALGADYLEPTLGTPLDLHLASQGARQVLAIIVQLFHGNRDDIVMIEEPEISLHPAAQVSMAELLADAVQEGKQVLISTHSHYLLLALGDVIRKGILKPEQVGVWEVSKAEDIGTEAKELPITKEGYLRNWVSSFAKVDLSLVKQRTKSASKAVS